MLYRISTRPTTIHRGGYLYGDSYDGLKTHFCSSYPLAQQVLENAQERYGNYDMTIHMDTVKHKEVHWDDGGMVLAAKKHIKFNLGKITVTCWLHHWEAFQQMVKVRLEDDERFKNTYNGKFYKLHSANTVICLSPSERDKLLAHIQKRKNYYDRRVKTELEEVINNMGQ